MASKLHTPMAHSLPLRSSLLACWYIGDAVVTFASLESG
jgi:hypothetical protein